MQILVAAQVSVQTLNTSVAFLETKHVILTNDVWCVVIKFDLGSYENVIAVVNVNFLRVQKQKSEFKPFSEPKQVEILLT
jgi:hypothetical protein